MKSAWPLLALLLSTGSLAAGAVVAPVVHAEQNGQAEPAEGISIAAALAASDELNIDLVTVRNALKTATASLRSANTAPNPSLSVSAVHLTPGRLSQVGLGQISDTIVGFEVPLERGGKRTARVAAARADLAAAGSDIIDTRRQVHAAVATSYYDLMAAERRVSLNVKIAELYRTGQSIADKQLAAGAISGGDLARQQVEALRAVSAVSQGISDRREAQLALAVLIGHETDAADLHTIGGWPIVRPAASLSAEDIAENRPDVRAAVLRIESARRQLDGAHALRHPDVTAGVQYEHDPQGLGSTVGVTMSLPIPVRNRYLGEVDAAGTAVAQAEALAAKARTVAIGEIIVARRAAADASTRRQNYENELQPAASKAAQTAEFSYKNGALALIDLLDARRTLQSVELAAIDARLDEAHALARLAAAETAGDE